MKRIGQALAIAILLGGCAPIYSNHGYIPPEDELAELVVGVDTRGTVDDVVGPPTSTGVLEDRGYYYVRSRMKAVGPRRPQVVEREILAISFAEDGVIENIERFGLEDGQVVALSRRVTDSGVRNLTFLQQLFGNIGRFDPATALGGG